MIPGQPANLGGVPVVVSKALPLPPSPGEDARRIVRHGLADVLAWLGEQVGPAPGEATTHAVLSVDPGTGRQLLMVSPKRMHQLRSECAL